MFTIVERILGTMHPWIFNHPGAKLREVRSVDGNTEREYDDPQTGQRASYTTDDLGNVVDFHTWEPR